VLGLINLWVGFSLPDVQIIGTVVSVSFVLLMALSIVAVLVAIIRLLLEHKVAKAVWTLVFYLLFSLVIRMVLTLGLIAMEKPQKDEANFRVSNPLLTIGNTTCNDMPASVLAEYCG